MQLADASQAYLFTPIVFAPTEVLAGPAAVLHTFTLYMVGELVNGQSQNGASFLSPSGVGVEGVAFFVEHGGLKFIHAGGGWFWDSGGGNFVNAFAKGSTGQSLDTLRQVVSTSVAGNGGCVKRAVPSAGSGAIK